MSDRMFVLLAAIGICFLCNSVDGLKATVCEGGYLPLACPPDMYINVTSAMYGRTDKTMCPSGNISQTNCSETSRTLSAMKARCNGEKSCDVDSLSYYFGDPCPGIYKYLVVEYSCLACENKNRNDAECEMWALYGECNGQNADWMAQYCAKACYKCEAYIDSACSNVGDDTNCTLMASKGDCNSNPAYMGAYCKKACQQCDQPTVCANKANETECKTRLSAGELTKNSDYMLSNCTKSCFNCTDTIKCENKNASCDQWAMEGKCQSEPGTMMTLCTKSCLGCSAQPVCSNENSQCDTFAASGECAKNPVWMYKNCWKSCTKCATPHVCDNVMDDALCEVWAANGECSINPEYMLSLCRLSCTRCKALPYGRPKCIDALFNDTLCTTYAHWGECTNNPAFMLKNCYRTCTSCYSPYRIGYDAVPGLQLGVTKSFSIIMPQTFTMTAVLNQFTASFIGNNTVDLQVWRPKGSYSYSLVYSKRIVPLAGNQAQDIRVDECIVVNATDHIGWTTFSGASPISYIVDDDYISTFDIREAASVGEGFYSINAPFRFSLSASFTPGTDC